MKFVSTANISTLFETANKKGGKLQLGEIFF
jgi:hypothetical protein